ncbi:MAG TPA: L-serine ammonia-lyase, iron-sulfur-dependent, subunit beta [Firmicutes bacterium]|nr:L-serine ammonia-lyase, iron-sulfur-dependent, subunit beta [Bacillota bacterium]
MVGPSSSHTAGAVRLGRMTRAILGDTPKKATIGLHGSYARTFLGHGTDRAIAAGLLGFDTDDERIRDALSIAKAQGIQLEFSLIDLGEVHPNSALITAEDAGQNAVTVLGSSVGGGEVVIREIDGFDVEITGHYPTLLVLHTDRPGVVAAVTSLLAKHSINIASMRVSRRRKGETALMVIEVDQSLPADLVTAVQSLHDVVSVRNISAF